MTKKNKLTLNNKTVITANQIQFIPLTVNLKSIIRNDTMEGKEFLVAPMIMLVEGVHNGSNGPLYYPADELSKTPEVWNHKPVVVYHPTTGSACDPDVLTKRKIGVIMNTKFEDGKLKAEAWLEPNRIKLVDNRVAEAIENGTMLELSTGVFTDNENISGEWNKEKYDAIARNYRPDHLAILPDIQGACSTKDGAGFLRLNAEKNDSVVFDMTNEDKSFKDYLTKNINVISGKLKELINNELSHEAIRNLLYSAVVKKSKDAWVEDVFDDFCIYNMGGKLFKQNYVIEKETVKLEGIAEEAIRVTAYKTKSGTFKVNSEREIEMNKKEIVAKLIANENTNWKKDDEAVLMAMDEKVLEKMLPIENAAKTKDEIAAEEEEADKKKKEAAKKNEAAAQPETAQEFINKAPKEIQNVLNSGLASYNAEVSRLVTFITKNENNKFTKEQLQNRPIDELRSIAALCTNDKNKMPEQPNANYAGQGDAPVNNNDVDAEPLQLPVMNFKEKVA